jgi:ATP-dependent helicase HepA
VSNFRGGKHINQSLKEGMYIRVPVDTDRPDGEFRDYYLARIVGFDEIADTVIVMMENHSPGEDMIFQQYECPRIFAKRCHILSGTVFTHVVTKQRGIVLDACEDNWISGSLCEYYVRLEGQTIRLSESEMIVPSHRGDPNPKTQLYDYEFHHPSFKSRRDQLVECNVELQSATYGIEDLVGSRIILLAHQAEVVAKILSDEECRYILADEVGLGKTIEACVILKGLKRRHPNLRTLIIAPASLTSQWYFELDQKFWLKFAVVKDINRFITDPEIPGLIVSTEEVESSNQLSLWLQFQEWDLLIVDEAHHIHRKPNLFDNICTLSEAARRVLILSATPIQRRAHEFLSLLEIMNPAQYRSIGLDDFNRILSAQYKLLRIVTSIVPDLRPDYFDPEDFQYEMSRVLELLSHDRFLKDLVENVRRGADSYDNGLQAAKETIAYICENYRIERRVIRNRRINLRIPLPKRNVDISYAYEPNSSEINTIDELHNYIDRFVHQHEKSPVSLEYARLLLHAAFSSPHALRELVEHRVKVVSEPNHLTVKSVSCEKLITSTSPRLEARRIRELITALRPIQDEEAVLAKLLWNLQRWLSESDILLGNLPYRSPIRQTQNRLARVLDAVYRNIEQELNPKILVFSSWLNTIKVLKNNLIKHYGRSSIAEFHSQLPTDELQNEVDRFQSDESCKILLCDELGGEGRNFQIANAIIHVDLPWTPAKLEQRIGRVDRLGREGLVTSIVPFAKEQVEHDLFRIWQDAFHIFSRSLSGMEIALEAIQDELLEALAVSSRNGLAEKLDEMISRAEELREQVEEERFYEEEAINQRRRREFNQLSEKYRDGSILRVPLLKWAVQAGLKHTYKKSTDTVRYYPAQFSINAMRNAKFAQVPNMEEALLRSRNKSSLWITGTFNRTIAVVREDLVFFAPGSDPWTDAIIENSMEADRGRSCAVRRISDQISEPWRGLELFYRIHIDARNLYGLGKDPIHLHRSQGYIYTPVYRLLISTDGVIVPSSHPLFKIIEPAFWDKVDSHLGKRSGDDAEIVSFKKLFPPDVWYQTLNYMFSVAEDYMRDEFSFTEDLALEAKEEFSRVANGMEAALHWRNNHDQHEDLIDELTTIKEYRQISQALIAGIQCPKWNLESACFWIIEPETK